MTGNIFSSEKDSGESRKEENPPCLKEPQVWLKRSDLLIVNGYLQNILLSVSEVFRIKKDRTFENRAVLYPPDQQLLSSFGYFGYGESHG